MPEGIQLHRRLVLPQLTAPGLIQLPKEHLQARGMRREDACLAAREALAEMKGHVGRRLGSLVLQILGSPFSFIWPFSESAFMAEPWP